jgi:pyruvate formate lyase activating enzyme
MEGVLEYTNLVLYDIKHMDSDKHMEATGVSNELILANAEKTARKVKTWLRVPVIPDYNDSESNIRKVAEFGAKIGAQKICLLPYHGWGEQKYERLGIDYAFKGTVSPDDEYIQRLTRTIEDCGLEASIGR